jgi:hypothetical protein
MLTLVGVFVGPLVGVCISNDIMLRKQVINHLHSSLMLCLPLLAPLLEL